MAFVDIRFCGLVFAAVLGIQSAQADELSIVDVRRHITLSDDDIVYKDFYLNGGEGDGLKKGLVVTAVRKIQVRDATGSQGYGEILVPVGQLRVIATYGKVAVAREYKLLSRDELPMLEQTGLMSGDKIDLKGSFIDNAKPKYKKPTAAVSAPAKQTVIVAVASSATTKAEAAAVASKDSKSTGPAPASVEPATAPKKAPASEAASEKVAASNSNP